MAGNRTLPGTTNKLMSERSSRQIIDAQRNFTYARIQADLERVLARLTGKSPDLLSYNEVRQQLLATGKSKQVLKDIPLKAIVGSVGRYTDFTRSFLPLRDSDKQRWARIEVEFDAPEGLPPIEVYQIGDVYFVIDGNHRVSVARQVGATHIEAFVTEVKTKVPLSPDIQPDDLILKARYARFLEQTRLNEHRPDIDLTMTAPGNYRILERQIELVEPDVLVLLGGAAAKQVLNTSQGIMKLRGKWKSYHAGERAIPTMATLHPAYLLRNSLAKRQAWHDLLLIKSALEKNRVS